jgi:modulator of FtsH protease
LNVNAYDATNWVPLLSAVVAASAALVGLVFVGISINLTQILTIGGLTGRASEPIIHLVLVLLVSTIVLIPGQSIRLLGVELLVVAIIAWLMFAMIQLRAIDVIKERPRLEAVTRVVLVQVATLPFVIGSGSLIVHHGGGLYWLALGFVCSFVAAMIDAWVLLVEILR